MFDIVLPFRIERQSRTGMLQSLHTTQEGVSMDTASDQYKAMMFEHPERIPTVIGLLSATWMKHRLSLSPLGNDAGKGERV